MNRARTAQIRSSASAWLADIGQLTKWRLTMTVVFSSVASFAIAAGPDFHPVAMVILGIGGFLVAGAANALNQILERDYDKLMERTAQRPVASGRMNISEALVVAGLMLLFGIIALALFNPLTAFMGTLSVIIYAFIYTPLKRYSTISVAVGAIPGALPAMIGVIAFTGEITWLALVLFTIQFVWQFPHFWAIGMLSFDQYRNAGFRVVPERDGEAHPALGMNSLLYSLLLVPVCALSLWAGVTGLVTTVFLLGVSLWYAWSAYGFYRNFDRDSARRLMFSSFGFLPLALMIILIGGLI